MVNNLHGGRLTGHGNSNQAHMLHASGQITMFRQPMISLQKAWDLPYYSLLFGGKKVM